MSDVIDRIYEAVREFQEHPQGMFVNTSRGRELGMMNGGATAAMRVLLKDLLAPSGDAGFISTEYVRRLLKELGDA